MAAVNNVIMRVGGSFAAGAASPSATPWEHRHSHGTVIDAPRVGSLQQQGSMPLDARDYNSSDTSDGEHDALTHGVGSRVHMGPPARSVSDPPTPAALVLNTAGQRRQSHAAVVVRMRMRMRMRVRMRPT